MGLDDVELHLVNDVDQAMAFMHWLGERRPHDRVAVDTETSGLDWTTDNVRLLQVGDGRTGWAIPWDDWRGVCLKFFERYQGRMTFHHVEFDVLMLEREPRLKIPWGRVDCTMLMAYTQEHLSTKALKTLASRLVDPRAAQLQTMLDDAMSKAGWTWKTVPIDFRPYWSYGALDCVLTCAVQDALWPMMDEPSRRSYELELSATGVLKDMMKRGAPVDVEFAKVKRAELWQRKEAIAAWCEQWHNCSPGSNVRLSNRLIELGAPLTKQTKGGALSVDKNVLEEVAVEVGGQAGELAAAALRARQLTKICNTYLGRFIADAIDGRVYADISVVGAGKTGRMSVSGPGDKAMPLHQLPRRDDSNSESLAARDCFVAEPGRKLVMIDYEQIEWRLIGHFSQDPSLLEILRDMNVDPFLAMCQQIYSDPTITKKDHRRQMTKNAAYAKGYGAGAAKFSLTAGVPLSVGQPFYEAFDATFPTLKAFQGEVARVGQQRLHTDGEAWVRTPAGKKLVADPDKVYTLVNRLVQGTAADVMKTKLVELDSAGLAEYAILTVHDEVIFDFPAEEATELATEAARVMDASEMFSVPMPVGVDGPYDRWGDKYR